MSTEKTGLEVYLKLLRTKL